MNHIKNIKEMLSIPTGSRNVTTGEYSSLTDSQFLYGSQFWPENSQTASQSLSLSSRNSQQSSQEGSDPKISSSYYSKPLLFGELKDKNRTSGILDKFEEDRKKAKEKKDSDLFAKECQHIRETLNNIQQLVASTERNTAVCQTVFEKIDNFASTLQDNLNSLQSDISQHFETLGNKVKTQTDLMTKLEERVQKNGDTASELDSHLQSLKKSLESLREEQEREQHMLEEALKLLNTIVSEHSSKPGTEGVMDSAIQTSPGLEQSLFNILQDNKLESTQLASYNLEQKQVEVSPQDYSRVIGRKKSTRRGRARRKKRPLVLSQRSKCTVPDENSESLISCNKQQSVSTSLDKHRDLNTGTSRDSADPDGLMQKENRETKSSEGAGCFISPLCCWSQDSNSSVRIVGIEPILEKLSAEPKTTTPVKAGGFWQLFDINSDSDLEF